MLPKPLVPLLLLALLLGATAARAQSISPASSPAAVEEIEFEEEVVEEEESPEEECEEAREEFEEGEIDRGELEESCERQRKRSARGEPPERCVLRSAHAHAAVEDRSNVLKLTLGYTTYEPAAAKIDIGVGPTHVASLHRQLSHSGVIRTVESLPDGLSPKRLILEIRIPSVESVGCPSRRLVLFPG